MSMFIDIKIPYLFSNVIQDLESGVLYNSATNEIVAGNIDQFISYLFKADNFDPPFLDMFLATHKTIVKSEVLLQNLLDIFNDPSSHAKGDTEKENVIRVKVINIIKKWIQIRYNYNIFVFLN